MFLTLTFQKNTATLYPFGRKYQATTILFREQLKTWDLFCDSQRLWRKRMSIFIDSLKKRLTNHGFTQIFHLDQDLMWQDKLTTWIEYLNYEYRWHNEFIYLIERGQKRYDSAWKQLVDSKVLRQSSLYGGAKSCPSLQTKAEWQSQRCVLRHQPWQCMNAISILDIRKPFKTGC
jgi:hypothetical protein